MRELTTPEVGSLIAYNGKMFMCVLVSDKSQWLARDGDEVILKREILSFYFKDPASHEPFAVLKGKQFEDFMADAAKAVNKQTSSELNQTDMATKKKNNTTKPKAQKSEAKPKTGKIAVADEMLTSGLYTKAEVAAELVKQFKMPEKTARNTVNWAASTMKERTGKTPDIKPADDKPKETKPKAKKKSTKKKVESPDVVTAPFESALDEPVA